MDFSEPATLGRTGLKVGRLGMSSGYGIDSASLEEAFERGCNYLYWGSRRTGAMARAIKNLCAQGKRDELVILVQSYSRSPALMEYFLRRALRTLGLERVDLLLLGWHNKEPSKRILERALALKERGLFRFLGVSGHQRPLFPLLAQSGHYDFFHVRYNAAHRGAEKEVFPLLPTEDRPGIVTYTATRWGRLLSARKMPPGISPPPASSCYRFVLSNPSVDVVMCGPKNRAQMKEALDTLELGPLSPEEMALMIKVGDHINKPS